jgi:hypothetical protein
MSRRAVAVVVGIIVVRLVLSGLYAANADDMTWAERQQRVQFQTLQRPSWTDHEVLLTLRWSARRFGISAAELICVARRESGLNERAWNPAGYAGLTQHAVEYWPGRVRWYRGHVGPWITVKPRASVYSARANALVSARMVRAFGWGPWAGGC